MTDGLMSPEQRLQALEEMELRQQHKQRRVLRVFWMSIVVGALALGSIIAFSIWQMNSVRKQTDSLRSEKAKLDTEITALVDKKRVVDQQLKATRGLLKNLSEAQLKEAIDKQFATAPKTAALLPRIYMHIVDNADLERARVIRKALQEAGYLVLGIENVPKAKPLKTSDVRFYHKAEHGEAEEIVRALKKAGESNVNLNYLQQYENSTNARPNHFEVWLANRGE